MKRIIPIAFLAILISCNQTKIDKKAEGEKIMQLSKEWSQTVATKDIDKMVSFWADDAFFNAGRSGAAKRQAGNTANGGRKF